MSTGRIKFREAAPRVSWLALRGSRVRELWEGLWARFRRKPPPLPEIKPVRRRTRGGLVIRRCLACGDPLRSAPTVNCTNRTPHKMHAGCRSLTKDKCPICGFALEAAG